MIAGRPKTTTPGRPHPLPLHAIPSAARRKTPNSKARDACSHRYRSVSAPVYVDDKPTRAARGGGSAAPGAPANIAWAAAEQRGSGPSPANAAHQNPSRVSAPHPLGRRQAARQSQPRSQSAPVENTAARQAGGWAKAGSACAARVLASLFFSSVRKGARVTVQQRSGRSRARRARRGSARSLQAARVG